MARKSRKRTSSRSRRRRKKTQSGRGLDIQKLLGKTGIEFHWPGYQYMGPGTKLKKRLARGDPGINRLDKIAKQHDIDYSKARSLKDKHAADRTMVKRITDLPGKKKMDRENCKRHHASKIETKNVKNKPAFLFLSQ